MTTLADTYTNAAGLRTALRDAVGHPNQTVLLPDGTVDNALKAALDEFNPDFPLVTIGSFTTVAAQQAYSPLPDSAYGIRRVYWVQGCPEASSEWQAFMSILDPLMGPIPGAPIDELGTRTPVEPARVMALLRQQAWMRKFAAKGASIVERTIYLDPIPTSAQTVIFSYYGPRYATALSVRQEDSRSFFALVEAKLHSRLAGGAGAVSEVRDTNEGTAIRTEAPAHHLRLAQQAMARYKLSRPPPAPANVFP